MGRAECVGLFLTTNSQSYSHTMLFFFCDSTARFSTSAHGRNLFENPVSSHVEIEGADGTRLPAHRSIILASRSEYFFQLVPVDFSEANTRGCKPWV